MLIPNFCDVVIWPLLLPINSDVKDQYSLSRFMFVTIFPPKLVSADIRILC